MSNKFLPCDAFTTITDAWYNTLVSSLNLSVNNFQLIQPLPIPKDDQTLWDNFNVIPPYTLKYNHWYHNQPDFFSQYAAIVNLLSFPESAFKKDIGATTYIEWEAYLNTLPTPPPPNELPKVWFKWAMIHAPNVANIGRSDLACQVLINSAQQALTPYQGPNAKPADFQPKFSDLITTLNASSSVSFSFDSSNANPDVSNSWVPGYDPNLFGMWTGSWCGFQVSKKFAASIISISVGFEHAAVIPITPGSWYNSGMLHLALVSKSSPPWTTDPNKNWDKYFGNDGSFKYAIGSVLVADGISLTLKADANFTSKEQSTIKEHIKMGYWPLYGEQVASVLSNNITFNSGEITIQVQSTPGNPILIGNNVFGISQYLGGS